MVYEPFCQTAPLIWRAAIDGEAGLSVLVFTLLQIVGYFLLRVEGTVCHTQRNVIVRSFLFEKDTREAFDKVRTAS